ncbi:hypothetical protein GF362_06410 [Candidatus Dojkabacteria bacterium]|nr:hypothetical protein [Candidatus Dojkabacteria bacterium]
MQLETDIQFHTNIGTIADIEQLNSPIPFKDIHEAFASTKYGEILAGNIRYERFKPLHISPQEWYTLLGDDVNNLTHLTYTFNLAHDFLTTNNDALQQNTNGYLEKSIFNQDEEQKLLLSALIHDWGEAVVGDIPFDIKTEEDEELEFHAFDQIIHEINEQTSINLDSNFIKETLLEVVFGMDSKLSKAFNAIERLGYLTTGIKAWFKSTEIQEDDPILSQNLEQLANNVLLNQIPTLIEYASIYPAVHKYLTSHEESISQAFLSSSASSFKTFEGEALLEKINTFNKARRDWFYWI